MNWRLATFLACFFVLTDVSKNRLPPTSTLLYMIIRYGKLDADTAHHISDA